MSLAKKSFPLWRVLSISNMNIDITPQEVFETEIEAMKKSIVDLESVLKSTETAIIANRLLLGGLEQNLQDLHKETELLLEEKN
mgnify:CR=1 FL=1